MVADNDVVIVCNGDIVSLPYLVLSLCNIVPFMMPFILNCAKLILNVKYIPHDISSISNQFPQIILLILVITKTPLNILLKKYP